MEKKYIIIAVVVVVLWGAFMGYRHTKKKDGLKAHHEDTGSRLVEMAKKSPRAGLNEMGRALNKYYQDNKSYPNRLDELYPKYIPSRAFLGEIDWSYEPGGEDFYLSKAIVYNEREMVAYVDKSLRPEMETGVAVATRKAPTVRKKAPVVVEEVLEEDVIEYAELRVVDEVKMTGRESDVVIAAAGADLVRTDVVPSTAVALRREMSKVVSRVGPEIISAEKTEFLTNLEHYLVWKDTGGVIGISNTQFPEVDNMYVAISDRWYKVIRVKPKRKITAVKDTTTKVEEVKGVAQLAQGLSREYLVWKDQNGVMGVGNIKFPESKNLTIAFAGEWNPLKRTPLLQRREESVVETKKEKQQVDKLAESLSTEYLVWKDEKGVIGIGNVEYPDIDRLTIASLDKWKTLKEEPLSTGRRDLEQTEIKENEFESHISRKYLMWKDKNGNIGFGNVQYPEVQNISYVHSNRSWEKVVN